MERIMRDYHKLAVIKREALKMHTRLHNLQGKKYTRKIKHKSKNY